MINGMNRTMLKWDTTGIEKQDGVRTWLGAPTCYNHYIKVVIQGRHIQNLGDKNNLRLKDY